MLISKILGIENGTKIQTVFSHGLGNEMGNEAGYFRERLEVIVVVVIFC